MSRYRVSFNYEIETFEEYNNFLKKIEEDLKNTLGDKLVSRTKLKIEQLRNKKSLIRIAEFDPEEILKYINETKKEFQVGEEIYTVKMNSIRYSIFKESMKCVACGIIGTKMFLERNPSDKTSHFNLYAIEDGCLILMTKDHIVAKSVGGPDDLSNLRTTCQICNNLKSHFNLGYDQVKELRMLWNENRNKLTKKKFFELISKARDEMIRENKEFKVDT